MRKKYLLFVYFFSYFSYAKSTILCNSLGYEPVSIEISGMVATVDYYDLKTDFVFVKNEVFGKGMMSFFKQQGGDGSFIDLKIYKSSDGIFAEQTSGKTKFIECSEF